MAGSIIALTNLYDRVYDAYPVFEGFGLKRSTRARLDGGMPVEEMSFYSKETKNVLFVVYLIGSPPWEYTAELVIRTLEKHPDFLSENETGYLRTIKIPRPPYPALSTDRHWGTQCHHVHHADANSSNGYFSNQDHL